jgi:hypothetical protein
MSRRTRFLLMCGSAALALATMPANHDPVQAATRQVVVLSGPQVSAVDATRTVVTFEAKGDIRGMLTLTLVRGSAERGAAPLTGEWALVSRYVRDMVTGNDDLPAGDHQERLAFVERGTIHGAVAGGTLVFDANGQLDSIESLRVRIAGGNLEFAGASGSGSASASNLQDVNNGSGTLALALEVK